MTTLFRKSVLVLALAAAVTACDSSDESEKGGNISPENYVTGEFKWTSDIGLNPKTQMNWRGCRFSERIFESDNIFVLGESFLPEDDFKYAATLAERALPTALSEFELTASQFEELKPILTSQGYWVLISETTNLFIHASSADSSSEIKEVALKVSQIISTAVGEDYTPEMLAEKFDNDADLDIIFSTAIVSMSKEQQTELLKLVEGSLDADLQEFIQFNENMIPSKVVVCLDQTKNEIVWGQGFVTGIDIAPKSIAQRNDADKIILHEMIHYVDFNVTDPIEGGLPLARWMSEGAGVYHSGMDIHTGKPTSNPTKVMTHDNQSTYYSDTGQAYKEYGQAYQYLVETYGKESLMELRMTLRHQFPKHDNYEHNNAAFKRVFSEHLTDYDEFVRNYPNLVNQ